jgi:hypothetical protein
MGANRSFSKPGLFFNKPNFTAEDVGNRKSFNDTKVPPDDVGNTLDLWQENSAIHDSLGNSLDEAPSHVNSGVWPQVKTRHDHMSTKKNPNRASMLENNHDKLELAIPEIGDGDIEELTLEFKKLLKQGSGLPFSFSMNPHKDKAGDKAQENAAILAIENTIHSILNICSIDAKVFLSCYQTKTHNFYIFFINPNERDPAKNKDFILALRQIVKLFMEKISSEDMNVLLVLLNAKGIIEEHLAKIGAVKSVETN